MSKLYLPTTEKAVLSTILNDIDSGWFDQVVRLAGRQDASELFFDTQNRRVFSGLQKLYLSTTSPTIARLADLIEENSPGAFEDLGDFILDLQITMPFTTIEELTGAVEDLREKRELRDQVAHMEDIISDIQDVDVEAHPQDVATRLQDIVNNTDVTTTAETFAELMDGILNSPKPMWRIPTGIKLLDNNIGYAIESGTLSLIAARPKVGKTVFMNNLVKTVQEFEDPNTGDIGVPLVLNLETKPVEFVAKMISRYICDEDISWGKIKSYISKEEMDEKDGLHNEQIKKVKKGIEWAREQNWLTSFDKRMSIPDIYALIQKAKAEAPSGARIVVFVDYIQLQVQNAFSEREEIAQLSRFYKKIAMEQNVAVVALAQFNRDSAGEMPKVHQLRGSGSLEQDSDTIVILHRFEDEPKYMLHIDMNTSRLSEGGAGVLFMDGATQMVIDMPEELQDGGDDDDDLFEEI